MSNTESEIYNIMIMEVLFSAEPNVFSCNVIRLGILQVNSNGEYSWCKPSSVEGVPVNSRQEG